MSDRLSLPDELGFTTTRIECELESGGTSLGTGFFFRFYCVDGSCVPLLITNKHVVEGGTSIRTRFTCSTPAGAPILDRHTDFVIDRNSAPWLDHPDPAVDLCAIPLAQTDLALHDSGRSPFYRTFNPQQIANVGAHVDLSAMEEIIMVGYPAGLSDRANNLPIFRKGITATRPDLDYNGAKEFLVDVACFCGSSGSPIVFAPTGPRWTRDGNLTPADGQAALLGVLYAGPQYTVEGTIDISPVPTSVNGVATSNIPMNLGLVIKAQEIMGFREVLEGLEGAIPILAP